jgi:hypothetical protein
MVNNTGKARGRGAGMSEVVFPSFPMWRGEFVGEYPLFKVPGFRCESPQSLHRDPPVLKCPVPIAFLPWQAAKVDDSKEHEGVSFAELWGDPVARTLWLAHKRFMITSQYFRLRCIQEAHRMRAHPERLLEERLGFSLGDGPLWMESWLYDIGHQCGPYLAWALQRDGKWPFWKIPAQELTYVFKRPANERSW